LLAARRDLVETNAYLTAREAEDQMVRLLLPNTVRRAWPEAAPGTRDDSGGSPVRH